MGKHTLSDYGSGEEMEETTPTTTSHPIVKMQIMTILRAESCFQFNCPSENDGK